MNKRHTSTFTHTHTHHTQRGRWHWKGLVFYVYSGLLYYKKICYLSFCLGDNYEFRSYFYMPFTQQGSNPHNPHHFHVLWRWFCFLNRSNQVCLMSYRKYLNGKFHINEWTVSTSRLFLVSPERVHIIAESWIFLYRTVE